MEHRCEPRRAIRVPVELWLGDHYLGRFMTRDITTAGMCVQMVSNDVGEYDFVSGCLHPRGPAQPIVVHGLVCHASREGVGVMFAERIAQVGEEIARAAA